MGRFDATKATIDANIKSNGNQEITGDILNSVMKGMVDATDAELTEQSAKLAELSADIYGYQEDALKEPYVTYANHYMDGGDYPNKLDYGSISPSSSGAAVSLYEVKVGDTVKVNIPKTGNSASYVLAFKPASTGMTGWWPEATKGNSAAKEIEVVAPYPYMAVCYNASAGMPVVSCPVHVEKKVAYMSDLSQPMKGKNIAFLGDSAIAVNGTNSWANLLCDKVGANAYKFAVGGSTYLNQFQDGEYVSCIKLQVDKLINSTIELGWKPDIIIVQAGGNDTYHYDKMGSLQNAFINYNWKALATDETIYGGIRYNLQRLREEFPDSLLIVGTVFQNNESTRQQMAEAIREVCANLAIPIIDSNKYSGITRSMECVWPTYKDGDSASIDNPIYNWVEPDGTIVSVDQKSNEAVKQYGLYTYDGTHKNLKGEARVAQFYEAQLKQFVV